MCVSLGGSFRSPTVALCSAALAVEWQGPYERLRAYLSSAFVPGTDKRDIRRMALHKYGLSGCEVGRVVGQCCM